MGGPGRLPWCPLAGWCARASLSLPHQGYGDHKPKSSTAAQEVKTLDGIFTEQVSGEPWGAGREGGPGRARLPLPSARCLVSPAVSLCTTLGLSGGRPGWHRGEPHSP